MNVKKAIILAGGRATRLGPLAAQLNKSLVSIRQKPIIVHQLLELRKKGYDDVTIVCNQDSVNQVRGVIERSLDLPRLHVEFAIQDVALGPGHALAVGVRHCAPTDAVVVLLADTYFSSADLEDTGDWVGIHETVEPREWCIFDFENEPTFVERTPALGEEVHATVGIYRFSSGERLLAAANNACRSIITNNAEVPMSTVLNNYNADRILDGIKIGSWQDVGDVAAVAKARRERFNSRSFNELNMNELGIVQKAGTGPGFELEAAYIEGLRDDESVSMLFPRIIGNPRHAKYKSYQMEFVDLPTLGELYNYWPARPELWAHILSNLIKVCDTYLWNCWGTEPGDEVDLELNGESMYINKVHDRVCFWDNDIAKRDILEVNGRRLVAGAKLIHQLNEYAKENVLSQMSSAYIHGDLNFTNILYSLSSDTFKLVDPRGEWGKPGPLGDKQYEFAKLRYSYAGFFPAITQGLWSYNRVNNSVSLDFGVQRDVEIAAMDEVLSDHVYMPSINAIEAGLFMSGAPLHRGQEAEVMYVRGVQLANEVLNG